MPHRVTALNSFSSNLLNPLPLSPTGEQQLYPIPLRDGVPDAPQILAILTMLARSFSVSPEVRAYTLSLLNADGMTDNDLHTAKNAICTFVQNRVKYLPDPVGSEYITSPVRMLRTIAQNGATFGDCDDHVLLLNSMLGSVGIQTKVVGVKLKTPHRYDHVISAYLLDGVWHDFDPCAKDGTQPHYGHRMETR